MGSTKKDRYLVLGIDAGIASCGFELHDLNNHEILEMGSHLFDAPQENKTKVSLAAGRRAARSARRNNKRTKDRQKHCMKLLSNHGLVPLDADKQWFQSCRGDKPILELRANGLDKSLTKREFAQILYSISGHRGYIPHGEGSSGIDSETGKVLKALRSNLEELQNGNYRTIGEMMYAKGSSRNRGGNYEHCVQSEQLIEEINILFDKQRSFGNMWASKELEEEYIANIKWQKERMDYDQQVYETVGMCTYFPEERRAAKADLSSEMCNAYERFGHILIVDHDGNETCLSSKQRERYIAQIFSSKCKKVTYSAIRKDLDLPSTACFKGIEIADEKTTEVVQSKAWKILAKNLPAALLERMLEDHCLADEVCEALTYASSLQSLRRQLELLSLDEAEIDAIISLPYSCKVFKGYGSRSLKALNLLLDAFADAKTQTLTDAEESSGLLALRLGKDNLKLSKYLPPYGLYDPTCKNPVVLRALSRMRHIINSIIKLYGVPDEIHIELGRDLKHSVREKRIINKRNKENATNNKNWSSIIAEIRGCDLGSVTGKDLLKYALREQQNQKDPYTNEPISLERMICEENYCQIDHILPYSRTCDDSRDNKVLVLAKSNQDKRERTPYEWMSEDGQDSAPSWDDFKNRVLANSRYPYRKKRDYLLNTDLSVEAENGFLTRNLNDTRYMARAVKSFIEDSLLFPDNGHKNHVISVSGGATASLRHVWGLNFGPDNKKNRSDDRHHAVDAAVIAACSASTIKKVAQARSLGPETYKHMRKDRLANTQPWPSFAQDVIERYENIVPTRMVNHGVTGRAFEETAYRFDGFTDDRKKLAILSYHKNGELKTASRGNIKIDKVGNARLLGEMAFLQLWLDSEANKGKGKWYADPVYYAEMPLIKNGTYIPKAIKSNVARFNCEPIPESAMKQSPIVLFRGDVIEVDGKKARYWSFNIANMKFNYRSLLTDEETDIIPTFGKWNKDTKVRIIQEDCLGHCYDKDVVSMLKKQESEK